MVINSMTRVPTRLLLDLSYLCEEIPRFPYGAGLGVQRPMSGKVKLGADALLAATASPGPKLLTSCSIVAGQVKVTDYSNNLYLIGTRRPAMNKC